MRIEHVVVVVMFLAGGCGLLASPADYGSEYASEGALDASDESSEDGD